MTDSVFGNWWFSRMLREQKSEVKHQNARRGCAARRHLTTGPPFDPRFQSRHVLLMYVEY